MSTYLPMAVDSIMLFLKKRAMRGADFSAVRRKDVWSIPLVPLREAVINALVHADYSQRGAPIVVYLAETIRPAQVTEQVTRFMAILKNGPLGTREAMALLGLKHRPTFFANYLLPALKAGLVEMTVSVQPSHLPPLTIVRHTYAHQSTRDEHGNRRQETAILEAALRTLAGKRPDATRLLHPRRARPLDLRPLAPPSA